MCVTHCGWAGRWSCAIPKRADAQITLIDKRNFHLFQPLLYQVATGSLSPGEIASPLRAVLNRQKNTEVLMGEAADIDPHAQQVTLLDGGVFPYDSLIIATGSQTSYYGKDEWREQAPSLKTIEEATAIRHKLLNAFERAERAESEAEARAWLTFVIVGAGATGLEMAGALAEIANETLRHDFRNISPQESQIYLLDGGSRVLSAYPEDLSAKAETLVSRLGVKVIKGALVDTITSDGVVYKHDGREINLSAKTVLWAGGVMATEFGRRVAVRTNAEADRSGKIKVLPDLTLPNFPNIFLAGDLALVLNEHGKPLPGVAQVAIQEGHYAGKTIAARLKGKQRPSHFIILTRAT